MTALHSGCLGYFDSFSGLVPVKVLSVTAPEVQPLFDLGHGQARISIKVRAKVTEKHGVYKAGEIIESDSVSVVPRGAIRRGEYHTRIAAYSVTPDNKPAQTKELVNA